MPISAQQISLRDVSSQFSSFIDSNEESFLAGISQIAAFIILCNTNNQDTPLAIKGLIA